MKLARALSKAEAKKVQIFILLGGICTTLAMWVPLEDPINLPKLFVLVMFTAVVLGHSLPAFFGMFKFTSGSQRIALSLIVLFLVGLLIATLATDVKYTAIFGEYHRNNGALSMFSTAVIAFAGGVAFTKAQSLNPLRWVSLLGLFLSIYGIMQFLGKDPVAWNNPYNPIVTTVGNPNFTSGIIGISSIASLYLVFESKKIIERLSAAFVLIFGLFVVYKSDSVQGLFAFAVGTAILLLIKAWTLKPIIGVATGVVLTAIGTPIALAVINIGPLASRLYQGTLNNRLDYWAAALNMFKSNPLLGVGIDRYGENYREFAVQDQFVQGMFSTNAHNVYLHILATGGLTLFIPYVLLLAFITWLALISVKNATKELRVLAGTYLGTWLAFLILNAVTIDNLGVGIWLWIFAGIIIARSANEKGQDNAPPSSRTAKKNSKSSANISIAPSINSLILVTVALAICVPLTTNSLRLSELGYYAKTLEKDALAKKLISYADEHSSDPQTLTVLGRYAIEKQDGETMLYISKLIREVDQRAYIGSYFPAIVYDAMNKRNQAVPYREKLLKIDRWSTNNMLQLVRTYYENKDYDKVREMAAKLKKLYPESEDSKNAQKLVKTLPNK